MKMKLLRRMFCILFAFTVVSTMLVYPNEVFAKDNYKDKINCILADKLDNMGESDTIDVSVWFKDIDESKLIDRTELEIENKIKSNELNNSVSEVLKLSSVKQLDNDIIERIKKADKVTSVEDVNKVISIKRKIASDMYKENNKLFLNKFLSEKNQKQSIIYVSRYSPNVLMSLTKKEILNISKLECVNEIFAYDSAYESLSVDNDYVNTNISSLDSLNYNFSTYMFDMTGIETMRDTYNFTGEGVKIGMLDYPFANSDEIDYFGEDTIQLYHCYDSGLINAYTSHGNANACLIAGNYYNEETGDSFLGAVPDAKLYLSSGYNYRQALETLLDNGVNVINASLLYGGDNANEYGDTSKWIDHIASVHHVIYVGSAGNYGENTVGSSQMGYNSITVGSCNSDGEVSSFSSYSSNGYYKPDLLAPGENIILPATRDSSTDAPSGWSGTSIAAPVVTGAVAQLCQASPVLASNPRLMKSVLLSGTTINNYMDENELITTTTGSSNANNDFSRKYGAGILNVETSYLMFSVDQTYISDTMSPKVNTATYNVNINATEGQLVRVCVVFDKYTTVQGSHTTGNTVSSIVEPFYLSVTDPDNVKYSAYNLGDTKIMVSFVAERSGNYTIYLARTGRPSSYTSKYSISACVQDW